MSVEKEFRRLVWVTGINGYSILLFAGLITLLCCLFFFSWSGFLVGVALTAAAWLEVKGSNYLKNRRAEGLLWAERSQIAVFLTIFLYSSYQLLTVNGQSILSTLPEEIKGLLLQLYQIDEIVLGELLTMVTQVTYAAIILASLFYQGGLLLYYRRKRDRLSQFPEAV